MTQDTAIKLFNDKQIRTLWDDTHEKWYFSIVDVVGVLAESSNPQIYWRVLKKRLLDEENETVTNCNALKMLAADGKMRLTDVADTEQLFRLIPNFKKKRTYKPFRKQSSCSKRWKCCKSSTFAIRKNNRGKSSNKVKCQKSR